MLKSGPVGSFDKQIVTVFLSLWKYPGLIGYNYPGVPISHPLHKTHLSHIT